MAIEARISNGAGLLHANGASRANMFSGDAPYSLLTISTVLKKREGRPGRDHFAHFASGNLGLVSLPALPGRVTLERIEERYPRLIAVLRAHPGIGFVLVRSEARGAVVLGARGARYLDEDRVEGDDPLAPFGPHAARKVGRTDAFVHCADLMINGAYFADVDEVTAFEQLVGSHGGMSGDQEHAFVLAPGELEPPGAPLLGAGFVHRQLRRWLAGLGHEAYRDRGETLVAPGAGEGRA